MIVLILGSLTKLSHLIAFLPAIVLMATWRFYRRQPVQLKRLILGILIPALLILSWQYIFTYVNQLTNASEISIIVSPFAMYLSQIETFDINSLFEIIVNQILSIIIPFVFLILYPQSRKDRGIQLSWLVFLIAVAQTYLLGESGERLGDGNLLWTAHLSLFILYTITLSKSLSFNVFRQQTLQSWIFRIILVIQLFSGLIWFVYSWRMPGVGRIMWWYFYMIHD